MAADSNPRDTRGTAWSTLLTPTLTAGFAAIVIVLIVLLFSGLANVRHVYRASEAVTHTHAVKTALERLLSTVVDAETGQRGFVITGDDKYLEPYDRARAGLSSRLAEVRSLTADNVEQLVDVERLVELSQHKLSELDRTIALRRQAGFTAARELIADDVGRQLMDNMRAIAVRMEAREDQLLAIRSAEAARDYYTAEVTHVVGMLIGLLAVSALFAATVSHAVQRARAARALEAKHAELRQALQLKDEFVSVISHELRTPMTTIVGWARMLEERSVRPEKVDDAIAAINRSADALRQLIDDLLDTSQLVSGRMRLSIGKIDLREVVAEAVETVRLSAENKGVALMVATPHESSVSVQGDATRLRQVLWNLLSNAIKFTPTGGQVALELTATEHGFRLEVRDTGAGIEPDFLPYVFDRFRQGRSVRQQGVGLGLAIVRHLVELHGGTVTAQSDGVGKGSTFVVELPAIVLARAADRSAWSALAEG
jgi:signal transduction histidine kinase